MIKLYFKQAFHLLKDNKLLSAISIIGTALAIAMIMVIVITLRATIAPLHRRLIVIACLSSVMPDSRINQT
jgi:putative ABC transport system permease protein